MITREDLTLEPFTQHWGGEGMRASVAFPDLWAPEGTRPRSFELWSTKGLRGTPKAGGGTHVNDTTNGKTYDWRGVLPANEMDEAIDQLVDYINDLIDRQALAWKMESALHQLRDALSRFHNSLEDDSRFDYDEEWPKARAAFEAVELAMAKPESVKHPKAS